MRVQVNLDTLSKINKFVGICSKLDGKVSLSDGAGYCVSAKSLLGVIATTDWTQVLVESEHDIYESIKEFIVE